MANKRNLKHTINYVCGELFAECIAVSQYSSKPDNENVNALLRSILAINNDMIKEYRIRSRECLPRNIITISLQASTNRYWKSPTR